MTRYDIDAARRAMDVRWNEAREDRLLGRMVASSRRRERRRQLTTLTALALAAGLTFHWLSTAAGSFSAGIAAGTGGDGSHVRPAPTGVGGSAGTG